MNCATELTRFELSVTYEAETGNTGDAGEIRLQHFAAEIT